MASRYQLQIEVDEANAPEYVAGMLIPIPPNTPHQTLEKVELDRSWKPLRVTAEGSAQSAWSVTFPEGSHQSAITYEMTDVGDLNLAHFTAAPRMGLQLSNDALELSSMGERLNKIVGSLASKFRYQSGFTNEAPLTCDILSGNCLSINEAFLQLTQIAEIPAAYYIGYFFESDQRLKSSDWHCWISTLTNQRFENWDIAHHLKRGISDVQAGLNPVTGTRFATSVGRHLKFELPSGHTVVPHLCEPRWVWQNGISKPCEVRISLRRLPSSICEERVVAGVEHRIDQPHFKQSLSVQ